MTKMLATLSVMHIQMKSGLTCSNLNWKLDVRYSTTVILHFSLDTAFVCDGYDTNNFFHINWGWDGYFDGYFNLNLLNPYDTNNVGYTGFSSQQNAIIGIQKPTDNSVAHGGMVVRSFAPEKDSLAQGDTLRLSLSIEYATGAPKDFRFGFVFRNENSYHRYKLGNIYTLEGFQYYPKIGLTTTNFTIDPGTYELHFIYTDADKEDWKDAPLEYGSIIRNVRLIATEMKSVGIMMNAALRVK